MLNVKWALDECCWNYFHKCYITLDTTIFNIFSAERDYECRSHCAEYYFLSDTKTTQNLKITSEYYLLVFWLIYVHVISRMRRHLSVYVACTHIIIRAICWALQKHLHQNYYQVNIIKTYTKNTHFITTKWHDKNRHQERINHNLRAKQYKFFNHFTCNKLIGNTFQCY